MITTNINNKDEKYRELEGIRGLAAILVVIFHIPIWNPIFEINFILNSYLMLDLVFVVSGCVIRTAYCNIDTIKELIRFQFLRFARLYPIHFFILLIYILLELIRYVAVIKFAAIVNNDPFKEGIFITILQHFFLVQGLIGNGESFNVPAWSISVEFYTYMLFGIIALICENKYKLYIFIFLSIFALTILIVKPNILFFHGSEALFRCFAGFFIGCVISRLKIKMKCYLSPYISNSIIVLAIIFISIKTENAYYDAIIYLISALLIIALVLPGKSIVKNFLSSAYLVFLGSISYSIYMSHYIIIRLFDMSLRRFFAFPVVELNGSLVVELSTFQTILITTIMLFSTVLISYLLNKYVETPFRDRSRHFAFTKLTN